MKAAATISFLIVLLASSLTCFPQGKIDRSKREIKDGNNSTAQPPAPAAPAKDNSIGPNCEERTLGQQIGDAITKGIIYLTFYSTIGNYEKEDHLQYKLAKYPYYNDRAGNYDAGDSITVVKNRFRLDADYRFLYSGKDLTGHHISMNLRPLRYFYLQAQYRELREAKVDAAGSHLSLFEFNFCYDRIRFERFNLGWKAGINYIANHINRAGFSIGLDAEAFIVKPISLYVSTQWSKIHQVPVNSFDAGIKLYRRHCNFQLGYEHLKIGSPLYDYVSLGVGVTL